uniref:Uncharacterized protein n=1 Tax=Anopheles atroparvus TaxID=41427 RepID=A0A182J7J3_ANOAO
MDRKNGTKQSISSSSNSKRKLSIKSSTGQAVFALESKDAKADRLGGKVDWNSNIPQQQQQQAQQQQPHPSNFASVHRPRQLSSSAAIKRTAGQTAAADAAQLAFYGLEVDWYPQQQQQQHQQPKPQLAKGGPSKAVPTSQRPEPYGINLLVRSNAKVAVLPSCKEPATVGPFSRSLRPLDSGVIGENNGRIFNQPSLPLPVQIPNPPYAIAPSSAAGPPQRPQQQAPASQKTDYPLQSDGIRQGVNQKWSSSAVSPPGPDYGSVRFARQHSIPVPVPAAGLAGGKLTPKLLNDIYEKHLLSQTTFEAGSTGPTAGSTGTKGPTNQPPKHGPSETNRTLTKSDTRLRAAASFGGTPQKGSGSSEGSSTAAVAHNYDQDRTTATRTPGTGEDNLYESVRSNYHIYEKIGSRRSSLGGPPGPATTATLEQYVRPVGPQPSGLPPPLHPRPKSHPASGIDPHANDVPSIRIPPAPPTRHTGALEQQNAIPVKTMASRGFGSSSLSPIQERPPLPPTTTNRATPQRSASTRSERVNIALETAKAIATAAYIESIPLGQFFESYPYRHSKSTFRPVFAEETRKAKRNSATSTSASGRVTMTMVMVLMLMVLVELMICYHSPESFDDVGRGNPDAAAPAAPQG